MTDTVNGRKAMPADSLYMLYSQDTLLLHCPPGDDENTFIYGCPDKKELYYHLGFAEIPAPEGDQGRHNKNYDSSIRAWLVFLDWIFILFNITCVYTL